MNRVFKLSMMYNPIRVVLIHCILLMILSADYHDTLNTIIPVTVEQCDRNNKVLYVWPYKVNTCICQTGTTITALCLKKKVR